MSVTPIRRPPETEYHGAGVDCYLSDDHERGIVALSRVFLEESWDEAISFAYANGLRPASDFADFTIGDVNIYCLIETSLPPPRAAA